jgi:hypothetical protein
MKFTLRDVFWLLLVVGLALGWWLEYRNHAKQSSHVLKHWIETQGHGTVRYRGIGKVDVTDKRTGKTSTFNVN